MLQMTGELFFENVLNEFNIKQSDVAQLPPLVLAYIGDTVYEVYIRTMVISEGIAPVHKLHRRSTEFVKAKAQSDIIHGIIGFLSEEEQDIVRRGRNAKSGTIPKNADVTEYKYATGFESLLGYLYLKREFSRLIEVLKMSVSVILSRDKK
ncbi:MAG TPA: Mini-ribonuclease 3 [Clostridiaceae bacterium]|nr:Mini-ribonuclease 3 [Clostridiaceae bacterium]